MGGDRVSVRVRWCLKIRRFDLSTVQGVFNSKGQHTVLGRAWPLRYRDKHKHRLTCTLLDARRHACMHL
eukprot:6192604-Pleurochrysis_carterae.AAC.4